MFPNPQNNMLKFQSYKLQNQKQLIHLGINWTNWQGLVSLVTRREKVLKQQVEIQARSLITEYAIRVKEFLQEIQQKHDQLWIIPFQPTDKGICKRHDLRQLPITATWENKILLVSSHLNSWRQRIGVSHQRWLACWGCSR